MSTIEGDRTRKRLGGGVLDSHEAAWFVGAHVETVRRLARRGEIPAYKVGKDWRFSRKALDQWRETHYLRSRSALVLVAGGELPTRKLICPSLEQAGYRVALAVTGQQALTSARVERPDLVLLDLGITGAPGIEVFRQLHTIAPSVPIVLITGDPSSMLVAEALRYPPVVLLAKPVEQDALLRTVHLVLHGNGLLGESA